MFEINIEVLFFLSYFFAHVLIVYGLYKKYQYLNSEHEKFFDEGDTSKADTIETIIPFKKEIIPYEEKYLTQVRNMKNESFSALKLSSRTTCLPC